MLGTQRARRSLRIVAAGNALSSWVMATQQVNMRLNDADVRRLDRLALARRGSRADVVRSLLAQADDEPLPEPARVQADLDEGQLIAAVVVVAEHQWRAAAWLLERGWPERWAPRRTQAESPMGDSRNLVAQSDADDPFAEVDELARRRRRRP